MKELFKMEQLHLHVSPLSAVLTWRKSFLDINPDITSKINAQQNYLKELKQRHSKTAKGNNALGLYNKLERYVATTLNTETPPHVAAMSAKKLATLSGRIREQLDEPSASQYAGECRALEMWYNAQSCQYYGDIVGELGFLERVLVYLPESGFEALRSIIIPRIQYSRVSLSALGTKDELAALEADMAKKVQEEKELGLPLIKREQQTATSVKSKDPSTKQQSEKTAPPVKDEECSERLLKDVGKIRRFAEGTWGVPTKLVKQSKAGNACLRVINVFNPSPVTCSSLVTYATSTHPLHPIGSLALATIGLPAAAVATWTGAGAGGKARKDFVASLVASQIPPMIADLLFDIGGFLDAHKRLWLLQAADLKKVGPTVAVTGARMPIPIPLPTLRDAAVGLLPPPTFSLTSYCIKPAGQEAKETAPKGKTGEQKKPVEEAKETVSAASNTNQSPTDKVTATTTDTAAKSDNNKDGKSKAKANAPSPTSTSTPGDAKEPEPEQETPKRRRGLLGWFGWPFGKKSD